MNYFNDFSIVTITYNDNEGLSNTIKSISNLIEKGTKHIIIDGARKLNKKDFHSNTLLISEKDQGIYDALNKGISYVKTKYFMLLHSGDCFISSSKSIYRILEKIEMDKYDFIISNQYIALYNKYRKHRSDNWSPWMLKFGAQPAHLPTIYNSKFAKKINYDSSINIIADFFYFGELFSLKPKWGFTNDYLVRMNGGGKTSSGLVSFFRVSNEFIKQKGLIKGLIISLFRVPFKILQSF